MPLGQAGDVTGPDRRSLPVAGQPALGDRLATLTAPAALGRREGESWRCLACAHRCRLSAGQRGLCGVRAHVEGELRAPWGYIARRNVRAVETNTIFHVRPGARALTFGMYGCDLHCPYCHNWQLSQALRVPGGDETPTLVTPAALIDEAIAAGCEVVCAAYNEPMLAVEWVAAIFTEARRRGLVTAVISDGHTTPEALRFLRPVADVFRIDLKAAGDDGYRRLGGRLGPVLDAIGAARRLGYWVEVVTLIVPGISDEPDDVRVLSAHLLTVDPAIPWHLNGFVPRYRMAEVAATPAHQLLSLAGAAYARGHRFVYVGNVTGAAAALAHTRCPDCHLVLVERRDYRTTACQLVAGRCPRCGAGIPGLWPLRPLGGSPHADAPEAEAGIRDFRDECP
jgi:pyruvate formate lyase activating enzyme